VVQSDLVLNARSEVHVDLRMEVGAVVQQATVRAAQRPPSRQRVRRAIL
jgi:hypothetical protein